MAPLVANTHLATGSNHIILLENNLLDESACPQLEELKSRALLSGAVLRFSDQGNLALRQQEFPQWRVVQGQLLLLEWIGAISTEELLYRPCL